ncbi:MAG: ribosome assembly RNA-binding protein YhbY [Bacilli bacterium]|jgi:RNA-binding protein|nr:ribosome assembly RNA-binding protein YhbY [Bacilli bacterium]MCH4210498.1 ribosome assembly RNA-binding protein YhbY [Bacilli bacterium]MCH4228278.1 ribosome assembly RNA-binding protein YhbY [Bacilli bacterium]MCH4277712.1 ribosome assembly RNA-binding protein YhbY [Bacilli bacterium]MCI2054699.1 ribosome assembly RNA-binding protein YhbY [Bacilli bacterium]
MLTPKNKALLKGLANNLEPSVNIGKGEVDETLVQSVSNALKAHELIKVKVLANSNEDIKELSDDITKKTKSELVQIIGHIIVIYKAREKNPSIVLY